MSSLIAVPELITTAATDLGNIGSTLSAARTAVAASTVTVLPAAEDEVSAAIAAVFSAHGQGFQALGVQAAAFHEQFVQTLTAGAFSYASAETAITSLLNNAVGDITGLVANVDEFVALFSMLPLNTQLALVAAAVEFPFLVAGLLLTSPIWIPLLVVASPLIFVVIVAAG